MGSFPHGLLEMIISMTFLRDHMCDGGSSIGVTDGFCG